MCQVPTGEQHLLLPTGSPRGIGGSPSTCCSLIPDPRYPSPPSTPLPALLGSCSSHRTPLPRVDTHVFTSGSLLGGLCMCRTWGPPHNGCAPLSMLPRLSVHSMWASVFPRFKAIPASPPPSGWHCVLAPPSCPLFPAHLTAALATVTVATRPAFLLRTRHCAEPVTGLIAPPGQVLVFCR